MNDQAVRAAFLYAPELEDLGHVPVNLVALGCLIILGFGHPAFWVVALIGELGYLSWLSSRPWFQGQLEERAVLEGRRDHQLRLQALMMRLPGRDRWRQQRFDDRCGKYLVARRNLEDPSNFWPDERNQIQRTRWTYLKLLLARAALLESDLAAKGTDLSERVAQLRRDLEQAELSDTARESKRETLRLLEERIVNRERRTVGLEELDAELERLDVQLDLALESAALERHESLKFETELTRRLLDSAEFGTLSDTIRGLDLELNRPRPS